MFELVYAEYKKNPLWYTKFTEDILQDALVYFVTKNTQLTKESDILAWIYKACINLKKSEYKTTQRHLQLNTQYQSVIIDRLHPDALSNDDKAEQLLYEIKLSQIYSLFPTELHQTVFDLYIMPLTITLDKIGANLNISKSEVRRLLNECFKIIEDNFQIPRQLYRKRNYKKKL
jgi:DNA-directed RNA polymerase specialized sigma24 family protein